MFDVWLSFWSGIVSFFGSWFHLIPNPGFAHLLEALQAEPSMQKHALVRVFHAFDCLTATALVLVFISPLQWLTLWFAAGSSEHRSGRLHASVPSAANDNEW